MTATPLSGDQTSQLMQILVANTPPAQGRVGDTEAIDWDTVVARAGDVLSPTQLASLQVFRSNSAYQKALQAARQDHQAATNRGAPSAATSP